MMPNTRTQLGVAKAHISPADDTSNGAQRSSVPHHHRIDWPFAVSHNVNMSHETSVLLTGVQVGGA